METKLIGLAILGIVIIIVVLLIKNGGFRKLGIKMGWKGLELEVKREEATKGRPKSEIESATTGSSLTNAEQLGDENEIIGKGKDIKMNDVKQDGDQNKIKFDTTG